MENTDLAAVSSYFLGLGEVMVVDHINRIKKMAAGGKQKSMLVFA